MPTVSWHSAESVSAFNRGLEAALRSGAQAALERHEELLGIWLFGSRARGDAGARSDVDLLLIASRTATRPFDRILPYRDLLESIPAPTDMLVVTPDEIRRGQDEPFYRRLLSEAVALATRCDLREITQETHRGDG